MFEELRTTEVPIGYARSSSFNRPVAAGESHADARRIFADPIHTYVQLS